MNTSAQKWCAWGGVALAVTFVVGWAGIGGFVPPPSPNKNAAEITEFFASHQTRTQLGLFLCLVGSGIYAFFTGAISVQLKSPFRPYFATMPCTTTTKAPVGPPICVSEPPRAEIKNPATTAVYKPACGDTPEEIAKAIASGSATRPTVRPATRSLMNLRKL